MGEEMKRATGRPSREEQERISIRLLDAARAAFCRHGMAGASMDRIAAEAGVTKHTIYRRYTSKEELLEAVVQQELKRIANSVRLPDAAEHDEITILKILAEARFAHSLEPENIAFKAFLRAESTFSPKFLSRLIEWDGIVVAPFIMAIRNAQARGFLKAADPADACEVLFSLIEGGHRWWRMAGGDLRPARSQSELFDQRWSLFMTIFADTASAERSPGWTKSFES